MLHSTRCIVGVPSGSVSLLATLTLAVSGAVGLLCFAIVAVVVAAEAEEVAAASSCGASSC